MLKKILFGLILIIVIILLAMVGLALTSNLWLSPVLAAGIQRVTGFPTTVENTDLSLFESRFGIKGLEIKNPKGFPDSVFASIPEIFVDFDLDQFLKNRRLYLQEIRLNVEEVRIVRNTAGETNISKLMVIAKPKVEMEKEQEEVEKAPSPQALKFFVEKMVLTIRKLHYQDEGNKLIGDKTIDLHIEDEEFRNIANPLDIVRIIVLQIMHRAALGNLGVNVDALKGHLNQSLAAGQQLATQASANVRQMGEQALQNGTRLVDGAAQKVPIKSEDVDKVVNEVSSKAKSLFGSASNFLQRTADSTKDETKS